MKKFILPLVAIVLVIFTTQCTRWELSDHVVDDGGMRIVSLAPNLTEILFELGLGEQVVGVTVYCTYPPEALTKEKIGDFINPNLEKIVSLNPTLVIAEHWPSSKTVPRLREFQLRVLETTSAKSLSEIYETIRRMGKVVEQYEKAERLINNMKHRVEGIRQRAMKMTHRPTVYAEIDLPSWTIGKKSFITEALNLCGARNLFEDVERSALQVSKETIIARNPEMILSFTVSAVEISQRPGWSTIGAVQNGWIIDNFDQDLLSRGNHRLVQGMEKLQARILEMMDEC